MCDSRIMLPTHSLDVVVASCEGRLRDVPSRGLLRHTVAKCGLDALRALLAARARQVTTSIDAKQSDHRVFIYEKCGPARSAHGNDSHSTFLPNVGREQHTYLQHVIEHYDDLAPHTLFTPSDLCGNERNHSLPPRRRQFITDVLALPELPKAGLTCVGTPYALRASQRFRPPNLKAATAALGPETAPSFPLHEIGVLPLSHYQSFEMPRHQGRPLTRAKPRPLSAWSEAHLGAFEHAAPTCWTGTFLATRQSIRARPRELYARLREQVLHAEPEAIHFLERLAASVYGFRSPPLLWAGKLGFVTPSIRRKPD